MTLIGKLIKDRRRVLQMEQKDLAKNLEVSVSYLWRLETGKDVLPLERVNDLAYALDMPRDKIAAALYRDAIRKVKDRFREDELKNRVILV